MVRTRQQRHDGFSIIEIVLGLTIMSLLVGITVTTYSDSAERAREQIAQDETKSIASAIQRWQLENRRPYPFDNVLPLVPRYVRSVGNDPWQSQYRVDPNQKIVYSFGKNNSDDSGAGDDVVYFYDTTGDIAPGPPTGLSAKLQGSTVALQWFAPVRNADGSQPVDDLNYYVAYIRSAEETVVKTFVANTPHTGSVTNTTEPTSTVETLYGGVGALDKSYYFTVRAVDLAGNISGPSNQAGLFVAKDVEPQIVVFRTSTTSPAIGGPFSFFIEVSDADSNLTLVEIDNWPTGGSTEFTTDAADPDFKINNQFKFTRTFVPEKTDMTLGLHPNIQLRAEDAAGNVVTSDMLNVTWVNNPPLITSINPAIKLLTVNPTISDPIRIPFTIEANDQEGNMDLLRLTLKKTAGTAEPDQVLDFDLIPPGPVMVRTTSFDFQVDEVAEYALEITAEDTENDVSIMKQATIIIKEDTTPPDALSFTLDPANPLITTNPVLGLFWANDNASLKLQCEAFEIESPPITYQFKITTAPFGPLWETAPSVNESDGSSQADGWYDVFDPPNLLVDLQLGAGLQTTFDEEETYFIGMRAYNAVDLVNITTVEPESYAYFEKQNPFRVDPNPPEIEDLDLFGKLNGGVLWVNDVISAEWETSDYIENDPGKGFGSGANLFKYRVRRFLGGTPIAPDPYIDWTTVQTRQIQAIPLPTGPSDNGVDLDFEVIARDLAGNWATQITTRSAKVDFTVPTAPGIPTITNQVDNVISVIDTVSAQWLGVFHDPESDIESYEWGVSTTAFVPPGGLPDVAGWIPAPGSLFTSGTISQNNLLTEGDSVHAVVRARNYAGGTSASVPSTSAIVNVSLFTELQAVPSTGLSPLSVAFTGSVTGGTPPYTYTFQFDGTDIRQWQTNTSNTQVTTSYTYNLVNDQITGDNGLPRPEIIARLIIEDSSNRVSQKDFIIDIREDILGAISFDNVPAVHFFKFDGAGVTPLWSHEGLGTKRFGQIFVESRGNFLVGVEKSASGTSGQDLIQHMPIELLPLGGVEPSIAQDGILLIQEGADNSVMAFDRNAPFGTLVQIHNDIPLGGSCTKDGWIRAMPYGPTGRLASPGPGTRFGCDSEPVEFDVEFWGASVYPDNRVEGAAVFDGNTDIVGPGPGPGAGAWMKSFSGVGSLANLSTSFGSSASPFTTAVPFSLAPVPGTIPHFSPELIGSRAGYWLLSTGLTGAAKGIVRVKREGLGFGDAPTLLTPDAGTDAVGNLDTSEDGQFFAALLSGDGSGATWSLGSGFVEQPTYHKNVAAGSFASTAWGMDMDDGGTRVAVVSDDDMLRIFEVDFSGANPDIAPPGPGFALDMNVYASPLLAKFGVGSATPSDVSLYRRPNQGLPIIQEVLSEFDDSSSAGGLFDLNPRPNVGDTFWIIKGVNMDKVPPNSIYVEHPSFNGPGSPNCGPISPVRTNMPPITPYGGISPAEYLPAGVGDQFHFLKFNLTPCIQFGPPGTYTGAKLTIEMQVGQQTIPIEHTFSIVKS